MDVVTVTAFYYYYYYYYGVRGTEKIANAVKLSCQSPLAFVVKGSWKRD